MLPAYEVRKYPSLVVRPNYLAQDRSDIQFAIKELSRSMANPTTGDMIRLKRLARYLKGSPRLVMNYPWQPKQTTMTTYSDADWAGCPLTNEASWLKLKGG